jgi:Helix-turn-helix domain
MRPQREAAPKRLLSVSEAAEAYGLGIHTLRGWVQAGKVPVIRMDANVWIDRHDIEAALQAAKGTWAPRPSYAAAARRGHRGGALRKAKKEAA